MNFSAIKMKIWKFVFRIYDLVWTDGPMGKILYGDIFHQNEVEQSTYNFEHADVDALFKTFDQCEKESKKKNGIVNYISFSNGIRTPKYLNSRNTYKYGQIYDKYKEYIYQENIILNISNSCQQYCQHHINHNIINNIAVFNIQ